MSDELVIVPVGDEVRCVTVARTKEGSDSPVSILTVTDDDGRPVAAFADKKDAQAFVTLKELIGIAQAVVDTGEALRREGSVSEVPFPFTWAQRVRAGIKKDLPTLITSENDDAVEHRVTLFEQEEFTSKGYDLCIWELTDPKGKLVYVGLSTLLECLRSAEESHFVPDLPDEWWQMLKRGYANNKNILPRPWSWD